MAWTTPRTWTAGEVVTNAQLNAHIRDELRYLKGNDGTSALEDSVVLTGTAHMLVANVVTSANRPAFAPGGMVYNTSSGNFQFGEGAAWFDRRDILQMTATGQGTGDIFYANTPTSIARLAAGGSGSVLQANGAAAPSFVPNAGAMALLRAASGTYTAVASGSVDSFNVAGVGANERIFIVTKMSPVTTAATGLNVGYGTGAHKITAAPGVTSAGSSVVSQLYLMRGANGTQVHAVSFVSGVFTGSSVLALDGYGNNTGTLNAAWTGTWAMALETTGVAAAGGTLNWSWNVYRLKDA